MNSLKQLSFRYGS